MLAVAYGFDAKDFKAVQQFVKAFPNAISEAMRDSATIAMQKIIARTPVDTGDARRSFGMPVKVNNLTYAIISSVGNGKNYTPFLELGTGIYGSKRRPITAKDGKWLIFPIVKKNTIKRWVRTKSVKGMKPNYMIRNTKKEMPQIVKDNINRTIQELIKKAGSK